MAKKGGGQYESSEPFSIKMFPIKKRHLTTDSQIAGLQIICLESSLMANVCPNYAFGVKTTHIK